MFPWINKPRPHHRHRETVLWLAVKYLGSWQRWLNVLLTNLNRHSPPAAAAWGHKWGIKELKICSGRNFLVSPNSPLGGGKWTFNDSWIMDWYWHIYGSNQSGKDRVFWQEGSRVSVEWPLKAPVKRKYQATALLLCSPSSSLAVFLSPCDLS